LSDKISLQKKGKPMNKEKKKMQAHIAPLQPAALAAFPPWGSSQGAGRADLRCEISINYLYKKAKQILFE